MKKYIIFSYDYELFFGKKSGTVLETLIKPTNLLLDGMDKYGFKGNFFVDWQMLKYLKQEGSKRTLSDYNLIVSQLREIIKRGHRIELHIHPHWVDAKYNGDGTWDFSNYNHYSLNSFSQEEILEMFLEGKSLLTSIARTVDPHYDICAFRAGGWAVQPFDKLKQAYLATGLKIDSSVAYAAYYKCKYSYYDFRKSFLKKMDLYNFNDDVLKYEKNGLFTEVPISVYKRSIWLKIIDKIYRMYSKKSYPITDGTHKRDDLPPAEKNKYSMVSMSRISPLTALISTLICGHRVITLIDHPKDYSPSVQQCFRLFSKKYTSLTYKEFVLKTK